MFLSLLFCSTAHSRECEGSPHQEKKKILTLFKILTKWNNCHGILKYKDGSKYVGEFINGKFSGQGTFVWLDGVKYVGEFKAGKRHGQGTYKWGDGTINSGIWKKDKLSSLNNSFM